MKTGRVISLVLVAGITLLCSFPVFGLDSYSYSKTNQDVYGAINYYYSVNAVGSDSSVVAGTGSTNTSTSSTVTGSTYVDYNFTVQVTNSSDSYFVADYNTDRYQFAIDVNTGNTAFFNLVNWSYMNSVLNYSDNMTVPSIAVGTNTGHIVFSWYDVDSQIILRPYETRTYSFTIRSTTDFGDGVNYPVTPYTAEGMSYFPSGSSFSLSKKPTSYTSKTIVELMNENLLINQELLDDASLYIYPDSQAYNSVGRYFRTSRDQYYDSDNNVYFDFIELVHSSDFVDSDFEYNVDDTNISTLYKINEDLIFSIYNFSDSSVSVASPLSLSLNSVIYTVSGWSLLGQSYSYDSNFFIPTDVAANNAIRSFKLDSLVDGSTFVIPPKTRASITLHFTHYYGSVTEVTFNYSFGNPTFSFGTPVISPVTDDMISEIHDIHETEESYYSTTDTAISDTGLSSYHYNSNQSGGISSVSNDFVRVWNALGVLNSVVIFSLTLNLALFILRHRRRI